MYRITGQTDRGQRFCAGIGEGMCAPILRKYMRGLTVRQIKALCAARGWTIEVLADRVQQGSKT
jgi:hypothetical protein